MLSRTLRQKVLLAVAANPGIKTAELGSFVDTYFAGKVLNQLRALATWVFVHACRMGDVELVFRQNRVQLGQG